MCLAPCALHYVLCSVCLALCALHHVPCTMCFVVCDWYNSRETIIRWYLHFSNLIWYREETISSRLMQRLTYTKTNLDGVCTLIYFTQVENTSPYDCSARLHTSPELKHRIATYCTLVPSTRPCPAVPPPLISIKTRPTASLQLKMASLHLLQHQMISAACQL